MTILGTPGDDLLVSFAANDWIVGFDGNDSVEAVGGNDTVVEGNGNDAIFFGGDPAGDTVYAGNGTDTVNCGLYSHNNDIVLGIGSDDSVSGGINHDYIVAPGDYATISGMGGADTIVLGGRHDKVYELFGGQDAAGEHLTQCQAGMIDRIYGFNRTDRLVIEGDGRHPCWHQQANGVLIVDGVKIADVIGHHLTHHELIFV